MPQSPTTTLGTAASMSIERADRAADAGGASSLRKSPIAIESGAAMQHRAERGDERAEDELRAPKMLVTGFQVLVPDKPDPEVA